MVRTRLTSTASITTMRKAGNRRGCSIVISRYSFSTTQYARRLSRTVRPRLWGRQLFMDRQDARQPAERKQSRCSNAERDPDLPDLRKKGFPVPPAQANNGDVQPVE